MVKIGIVDDHKIFREGLKQIIEERDSYRVVVEVGSADQILDAIRSNQIDVLILDISLPGKNGLSALREIKSQHPNLPVLIMTMHSEEEYGVRALRARASGFLTKDMASEELIDAIQKVSSGQKYISQRISQILADNLVDDAFEQDHNRLSDREFDVLVMLGRGMGLTEIANLLYLSVKTISTYRSRLLQKMNFKNNSDIVKYCLENRLL